MQQIAEEKMQTSFDIRSGRIQKLVAKIVLNI